MIHFHYNAPVYGLPNSSTDFPIFLFAQFYVDKNPARHGENVFCLQKNVDNPLIQSIYLLNEREYSAAELGVSDPLQKIKQHVVGHRLLYADVFSFVRQNAIDGYIVFANTDIFLDETIARIRLTQLHAKRQAYALLRYEYNPGGRGASQLFGPRYDSQDTWIFHSSQNLRLNEEKGLRFAFGKPGCDNKFVYVMSALGYTLFNDPIAIRTHHYHTSQARNYNGSDRIGPPYSVLVPSNIPLNKMFASFGLLPTIDIGKWSKEWSRFSWEKDNVTLKRWIEMRRSHRLAYAVCANLFMSELAVTDLPQDFNHTEKARAAKYFSGVTSSTSVVTTVIGKNALEAYHFIRFDDGPWTDALRGSKILFAIYSSETAANRMREVWPDRAQIWDHDFFPECSADFVFVSSTSTAPVSGEGYDVVITDEGTELAKTEYRRGRSVIVLESVLPLLFGIYNSNSAKMRPDILRMYMNRMWTKIE